MRAKNAFCALNSFEYFSSGVIARSRTVYSLMLFGFTPNVESSSSNFFAPLFQLVHSLVERIDGTSSALIFLKSQLLLKLVMIVLSAHALFVLISFAKSSFVLNFEDFEPTVALMTQMCSRESGWSALTAILSEMSLVPFFPKLILSVSFSTLRITPTPQVR